MQVRSVLDVLQAAPEPVSQGSEPASPRFSTVLAQIHDGPRALQETRPTSETSAPTASAKAPGPSTPEGRREAETEVRPSREEQDRTEPVEAEKAEVSAAAARVREDGD
jgi:hypothetical protein